MITLTKAISLLGKRVWIVYIAPSGKYGEVKQGVIYHVTLHAEKVNRGEWHAYVGTVSGGQEYLGNDIFLNKTDAMAEKKRRLEDGENDG